MDNAELAERFLRTLDAGEDARELRNQLADAAVELGEDLVQRGREVQVGGRHAWRRAIELAEALAAVDLAERESVADSEARQ